MPSDPSTPPRSAPDTNVHGKETWAEFFLGVDMDARAKRMSDEAKRPEPKSDPNSRSESKTNGHSEERWRTSYNKARERANQVPTNIKIAMIFAGSIALCALAYFATHIYIPCGYNNTRMCNSVTGSSERTY